MTGACSWCWGPTDEAYCCAGCQHDHSEGRAPPWSARAKAAHAAEALAHAAIAANDERHAEAIAAVRARAEHAEAERDGYKAGYETELSVHTDTRAEVARLTTALLAIEHAVLTATSPFAGASEAIRIVEHVLGEPGSRSTSATTPMGWCGACTEVPRPCSHHRDSWKLPRRPKDTT